MRKARPLSRDQVLELRRGIVAHSPDAGERLAAAIERMPKSATALRELHDLLLFIEAYPLSAELQRIAKRGKELMVGALRDSDTRLRAALRDSGLHGSDTIGLYSLTLVRWLLSRWPDDVGLFSVDAASEEASELLRPLLTESEREALDLHEGSASSLVDMLFGMDPRRQLRDLAELIDALPASDELREMLFTRLQVYVRVKGGSFPSLSTLRGPKHATHLHAKGLERGVDLSVVMDQPVGPPMPLSIGKRRHLIDDARAILCLMQRETDPITYAQDVQAFDMGRGLMIALFHMDPAHRLALESYVGFMAFKNGVPLGYGGAWVFPGRSKVGINVFPALRGGESAWFFAQLLRLYRQRFKVSVFEAENYQLGHGNADGLKSGAYWFYYRLGFRPWDDRHGRTAAQEFARMQKEKGHQPALRTLKELVADGLVLRVDDDPAPMIDTAALLMAAQQLAAKAESKTRQQLITDSEGKACCALDLTHEHLKKPGLALALDAWALPLMLLGEYQCWPRFELERMRRALLAKSARTEDAYQSELRRCRMLLAGWASALRQA
ncbi:MAG: hypothetical protein IPM12_03600 [Flavobacteriales bacterium]|nr:hypothetical protein [Flavobacteriales bacterium]